MAPTFDQIEADFVRLRDFVLNDLDRIVALEVGGNYAAAALIVCGYDAVADLRDGVASGGHLPFRDTLPAPWYLVAASLYDALRNGLVHTYETKAIVVDGREVGLTLAWRSGVHLSIVEDDVCLRVPDLADGLRSAFESFEATLRSDGEARDLFRTRMRRGRRHEVGSPAERAGWFALLD